MYYVPKQTNQKFGMPKSSRTARGCPNRNRRNRTELQDDITASILSRLETLEVLRTAQNVCTRWRRICKENSLVWQSIKIHDDDYYFDMGYLDSICRRVIDLSSRNLVDINIEYIGTDQLLKYMAERSSGFRRLQFVKCARLTDEGISQVASKLPLLEDLDISTCETISSKSLLVGTCSFPLLKSCKLKSLILDISNESRCTTELVK